MTPRFPWTRRSARRAARVHPFPLAELDAHRDGWAWAISYATARYAAVERTVERCALSR